MYKLLKEPVNNNIFPDPSNDFDQIKEILRDNILGGPVEKEHFISKLTDVVLASDAFFPFSDNIELAAEAGITAIVQPGGSIRDDEVIAAADKAGLAMVFTGVRHFRH